MKDTFAFPNGGYEITVVRKEDILETIDANITDKEIMLEIVKRLEIDATNYLKHGRWTGIPFLGSIRFEKGFQMQKEEEQKALLDDAFNTLDRNEYILFRRQLAKSNDTIIRETKRFKYIASMSAQRNKKLYNRYLKTMSVPETLVRMYLMFNVRYIEPEEEYGDE